MFKPIDNQDIYITSETIDIKDKYECRNFLKDMEKWNFKLKFHEIHQHILPNLSSISELVFCTTASSVPSECVFSGAGRLIDKSRSRLRPELAEDLLFLNRNQI